ncbi:SHOCT domain-containing protein [Nocardioides sp. 616]|uniref:SHOCT domain-containing protein n=1 Tax=Nocardioides sp. 616 TaxID=2268090 RepID=UPI000CE4D288|nr:SHOCT domain-containing protein [Nocardioides sp. 616]
MAIRGRVLGGQYVNATVTLNFKGELGPHLGLRKLPKLTSAAVARWERLDPDWQPRPGYDVLPAWIGRSADQGILTEAEFAAKKTELLARL